MRTKTLSIALCSVSLAFIFAGKAHAVDNTLCTPDQSVFEKIGAAFQSLDIRKTVQNMIATSMTDAAFNLMANRNPQQFVECSYALLIDEGKKDKAAALEGSCPSLTQLNVEEKVKECKDIGNLYDYPKATTYNGGLGFKSTQTGGSLIGLANAVDGAVRTEPVPANLAYYWNDQIAHVPFANKALAADVQYQNAPLIGVVLDLWKTVRNIAFGFLSVVMLVTGIAIMTRKKLNSQLVVTAQYAIPRIALAVILIVFSYPIGAVMATSMRYLAQLSERVVCSTAASDLGVLKNLTLCPASSTALAALILVYTVLALIPTGGMALTTVAVIGVALLIIVILKLLIVVRAAILYLQLIFSIILSPISFAMGAVPGNEKSTENTIKQWLSYLAGYVALFAVSAATDVIVIKLLIGPFNSFSFGALLSSLFAALFAPVIYIFGALMALRTPGKVKTFIMGDDKKKK